MFAIVSKRNTRDYSMDFNWKFSQTDTINADKISFNDSKWRTLNLPHDWSIENEFIQNCRQQAEVVVIYQLALAGTENILFFQNQLSKKISG